MQPVEIIRLFLLFGGVGFMLIGGVPLIIGIVQMYKYSHMKKHCTQKIGGRIIRYKNLLTGTATPVVEYFVNGKRYEQYLKYRKIVRVKTPFRPVQYSAPQNPLAEDIKVYGNSYVSTWNTPAIARMLPIGMFLDVFFNPTRPEESYVVRPVKTFMFYFCFFFGLAFFIAGLAEFITAIVLFAIF